MMQFFSRVFGSDSTVSRARQATRPSRPRRAQFTLETLEDRDLKSSAPIPGVVNTYGGIMINATQASHNQASVSLVQNGTQVEVSLNGQTVDYDASSVWSISYTGSYGGGDTFKNSTAIPDVVYTFGGGNTVVGGSSWNYALMYGNNDTYDAAGSSGQVFTFGASDGHINTSDSSTSVYAYSWNPYDSFGTSR
jgi:hypothetical protein